MSLRYLESQKKKTTNQTVCRKRDSKALLKASAKRSESAKRGGSPARSSRRQPRQGPPKNLPKTSKVNSQNKRKWVQEFTHGGSHSQLSSSSNSQQGAENNLKRRRIFVDVIELQHYGGLALCSNHIVNFKIGKYLIQRPKKLETYILYQFHRRKTW